VEKKKEMFCRSKWMIPATAHSKANQYGFAFSSSREELYSFM
jgi:hypothetical protein